MLVCPSCGRSVSSPTCEYCQAPAVEGPQGAGLETTTVRHSPLSSLGVLLLLVAVVLPFIGWFGGQAFVEYERIRDPVPQGAMVLAFLGFWASVAAAVVSLAIGIVLMFLGRKATR